MKRTNRLRDPQILKIMMENKIGVKAGNKAGKEKIHPGGLIRQTKARGLLRVLGALRGGEGGGGR